MIWKTLVITIIMRRMTRYFLFSKMICTGLFLRIYESYFQGVAKAINPSISQKIINKGNVYNVFKMWE